MKCIQIAWTGVVACALWCAQAHALVGDPYESFGLDGSLRTVTLATRNYDSLLFLGHRSDGLSQSLLRLTAAGQPQEYLHYELHGVTDLSFSTLAAGAQGSTAMLGGGGSDSRYRSLDLAWNWAKGNQASGLLWLDRCNIKIILPYVDITLGRQAVTFGKAYFWNPLDVFLPFDARQFDRDYKAGVDAARVDVAIGDFSGVSLVGVLGRRVTTQGEYQREGTFRSSYYGSALLGRAYTDLEGWDLAVQGGKVYGGYHLGGAAAGELGPLEVRLEGAYLFAQESPSLPWMPQKNEIRSHLSAVAGLGHRFENSLVLEAEYLYNGAGEPEDLMASMVRQSSGATLHMGRHLVGAMASYELLPILQGSLAWILSLSDRSSLLQPGLLLSVADEADFICGALVAFGKRPTGFVPGSEFGTYPHVFYMEFKFYF